MKRFLVLALVALFVPTLATKAAEAKANWDEHCAKCHGDDGKGQTKMGRKLDIADFTDAAVKAKFTDDQAFAAIKEGLKDANGKVRMKAIEGLSDDEIKALVQHVRGLKG